MRIKLLRQPAVVRGEMLRYARCGDGEAVKSDADKAEALINGIMCPCCCGEIFDITREGDKLSVGGVELKGESIKKFLADRDKCFIMAATVGFEVDRKIAQLSMESPALAILADAAASSAIEDACDACCEAVEALYGIKLSPRFSPGYGDFPLTVQPELLRLINAQRDIGLTVNSSLMLSPIKSVTAIVGVV